MTAEPIVEDDEQPKKKSQSTRIVELVEERFDLFQSDRKEPFAVAKQGPRIVQLFGKPLRAEVADLYFSETGSTPGGSALSEAFEVLRGRAARTEPIELAIRVGAVEDSYVLDLGTSSGTVVVINRHGWHLAESAPVYFRRTNLTLPMDEPISPAPIQYPRTGTSMERLRPFVNVTDDSFPLLLAWMIAALDPSIAHPILMLQGHQGTGKSTTAKRIADVLDPTSVPLRTPPHSLDDWPIAASGSWVVAIDNISTISPTFSDVLCRAVTGDGNVRRSLYTDGELAVLRFQRALILTSIDPGALAGDLSERTLMIETERIGPDRRRTERDLDVAWQTERPVILGALLDLAVEVLRIREEIRDQLDELPRMADFALILAAVDKVCSTTALATYSGQTTAIADDVLDSDPVGKHLRTLVETHGTWTGTSSELLDLLNERVPDRRPRGWPPNPRALTAHMNRISPALREIGILVERTRSTGRSRDRLVTLSTGDARPDEKSATQPSEQSGQSGRDPRRFAS